MNIIDKLIRTEPLVSLFQATAPGYGRCSKCGLPWKYFKDESFLNDVHFTRLGGGSSTFPFCKYCWDRMDEDEMVELAKIGLADRSPMELRHTLKCLIADKRGEPLFTDED